MYWVDPNGGCSNDSILVYCNFNDTVRTCLDPLNIHSPLVPLRNFGHSHNKLASFHYLSDLVPYRTVSFRSMYISPHVLLSPGIHYE